MSPVCVSVAGARSEKYEKIVRDLPTVGIWADREPADTYWDSAERGPNLFKNGIRVSADRGLQPKQSDCPVRGGLDSFVIGQEKEGSDSNMYSNTDDDHRNPDWDFG